MSGRSKSSGSSSEEQSKEEDKRSNSINRRSGDLSTKVHMKRMQAIIFGVSYLTNMFSLMGLSVPFVTTTFFDDDDDPKNKDPT